MIVERQVAFFLWIIHRALLSKKTNTTPTTTTTTAATTTINLAPHVGTNRRRKRFSSLVDESEKIQKNSEVKKV